MKNGQKGATPERLARGSRRHAEEGRAVSVTAPGPEQPEPRAAKDLPTWRQSKALGPEVWPD